MSVKPFGPGGVTSHHWFRECRVALLLGCVAVPAAASDVQQPTTDNNPNREILVVAPPLFRDVTAERQFDRDAIDSYGASTIDELLGDVQLELGDEADQPLIFVNGKRINDLSEIGGLPVEALRGVQVLPRGSAVRVGGTAGQRVISITLNQHVRSATVTAAGKLATDGGYHAARGEGILTKVQGNRRANLTLRGRGESRLFESDRGIIQPNPLFPFALGGNLVAYPTAGAEIDPLLSAAAGTIVTVAPVPSTPNPTLSGFASAANQAAFTDIGQYRTLRPATRTYDLEGSDAAPITGWLNASASLRLDRNTSRSLRGLPSSLFVLRPTNLASFFSRPVGLAYYGTTPLRSSTVRNDGELNITLNADLGSWSGDLNARHQITRSRTLSERQNGGFTTILPDSFNPFATAPTTLIGLQTDRITSSNRTDLARLSMTGPVVKLPAGPLVATIEGRVQRDRIDSTSTFGSFGNQRIAQQVEAARAAFDIPITSRSNDVGGDIGDLSATAEIGRAHYSKGGNLGLSSVGLNWEPRPVLRLHASYEQSELPASVETLGGAVYVYQNVRVFDPLVGQTVDVTEITGGNPNLRAQKTSIKRVGALLRLVPRINLQLNAEYTDTDRRNFVSSLPEASAAVMLAFPERYVRDSSGALTTMDLRPVNFASDREKRLRWGFTLNAKIKDGTPAAPAQRGTPRRPRQPNTYFQLTANHSMVFSDRIIIREGLAPVDLLGGGAIGIGGGRLRHQIDGTAALTRGGTGIRAGVTWRGASSLVSRINGGTEVLHFTPVMLINLRAFADLKQVLPHSQWAKGFRISLDVINLTNDRQSVRDRYGTTPLQYQPAYRDALGRTVELELRKVF